MRTIGHPRRVDGEWAAVGFGVLASVAVLVDGPSPTGTLGTDAVVVVLTVTAAVWAGSFAPWWAASALGLASVSVAGTWPAMSAGLAGVALAAIAQRRPVVREPVTALSVAAGLIALAGARDLGSFGGSSMFAIVATVAVAILGVRRQPRRRRRATLIVAAAALGACMLAAAGLALAAQSARSDLRDGKQAATRGMEMVKSGDFDAARVEFDSAAAAFRRADILLRRPWAQSARLVPLLAQHRAAGEGLAHAAASTSRLLAAELGSLDLDALRIVDGRIDIDAVRDLGEPLRRVNSAIERLDESIRRQRSPWLAPPVKEVLDEVAVDLADQRSLGSKATAALEVAPAMLGADGVRRYFVMFTTPAEARGLGGFMGNYAELTVDDGRISLSGFGRHSDLTLAGDDDRRLVDAPDDWLARYGTFGFTTGPGGTTGTAPWANITMSPHFPSTAQVVAELYPQSGGHRVDGVIALDVFALQEVVDLVGPIDVAGAPAPLDGTSTANFLLVGQYQIADAAQRTDLLESVARDTIRRLIGEQSPDPLDLGRALAPMVRERRVMAWSEHHDEQAMLIQAGLDGALLADAEGADGVSVSVDNAGGSKIDTFLERELTLSTDTAGSGSHVLTIRLRNDPPLGLPDYVVGNLVNLPRGTSRLFVSVHTSMRLIAASDPGGPLGLQPSAEAGFRVYSAYVDIPAGGEIEWRLELEQSALQSDIVITPQPLRIPAVFTFIDDSGSCTTTLTASFRVDVGVVPTLQHCRE